MEYEKVKYEYLAKLIQTKKYKNGKQFEKVDFFKFVSGYKNGEDLMAFMQNELCKYFKVTDLTYGIIIKFLLDNDYTRIYYINREWVYENPMRIHKVEVTKEMIDTVFDYMELNGYPSISYVYSYIFYNYATNKNVINKSCLSQKENILNLQIKRNKK